MISDKTIVYSKRTGEPPVPVTVRIEWLPDGTIRPRRYWMPDCSCFQVIHLYESTPLAFLREKSIGIRFKVRAGLTESPVPYYDGRLALQETYLHFVDGMYCGRNIIDSRYDHECKEYVRLVMDVFPAGDYELVYFWAQGARYMVEKTLAIEPGGSFNAGGVGIRHYVEARLINPDDDEDCDPYNSVYRKAALFFELNKWFISVAKSYGKQSVQVLTGDDRR